MRIYRTLFVVLMLSLLLTPLVALPPNETVSPEESRETSPAVRTEAAAQKQNNSAETLQVFLHESQKVITVSPEEYLIGVLACEMSPTFHEEALKAQAVAAHTFFLRKQSEPDPALNGADISDDAAHHQGYLSPEARKKKWGGKAESYEKKLTAAVQAVIDRKITYDGEPIIAAFHANNSGVTLSAEQVWGGEIPYLKSVKSPGDKLSPDCTRTVALSEKEFTSRAESLNGCKLGEKPQTWIQDIQADKNGFVKSMKVGGTVCTGQKFKQVFGLRSNVFTYEYRNGSFFFTTLGYGHGVGLSQYGADYLARQGKKWDEILTHYYTGVKIEKIK